MKDLPVIIPCWHFNLLLEKKISDSVRVYRAIGWSGTKYSGKILGILLVMGETPRWLWKLKEKNNPATLIKVKDGIKSLRL